MSICYLLESQKDVLQVEFNGILEFKCIAEFTRNMIPNGALMIAISLVQDCDCSCAPYIQIKRALIYKSYCYFQTNFFFVY